MSEDEKSKQQEDEAKERSSPSRTVVYKAILHEADDELKRSSSALFWSGLAAGLSMGFSLVVEALLRAHLPDKNWRPLIVKLGYAVGFLIVILGRQQLFTENTLTVIFPLLLQKTLRDLVKWLGLWAVVLLANLLGAFAFAWVAARTGAFELQLHTSLDAIAIESTAQTFGTN